MAPKNNQYWMIETNSVEEFSDDVEDVDIPIDSSVVLMIKREENIVDMFDVYRPHRSAPLKISQLGQWSSSAGFNMLSVDKWELRKDLTGVLFETSTLEELPLVDVDDVEVDNLPDGYQLTGDNSALIYLGPSVYGEIWSNLQQTLNFSYSMVYSIDGGWGSKQSDGTFNGIVSTKQLLDWRSELSSRLE